VRWVAQATTPPIKRSDSGGKVALWSAPTKKGRSGKKCKRGETQNLWLALTNAQSWYSTLQGFVRPGL